MPAKPTSFSVKNIINKSLFKLFFHFLDPNPINPHLPLTPTHKIPFSYSILNYGIRGLAQQPLDRRPPPLHITSRPTVPDTPSENLKEDERILALINQTEPTGMAILAPTETLQTNRPIISTAYPIKHDPTKVAQQHHLRVTT